MNRIDTPCLRIAVALVFLGSVFIAPAQSAVAAPRARAVWIWEEDAFSMLDKDEARNEVEAFLERHHISTMYLYADEFNGGNILVSEPEKYRKLIASAHAKGIKVFALLGSAHLRTQEYILPEKRSAAVQMFGHVLDYNNNQPDAVSRFDGVNIDIEPYLLDDWSSNRPLRGRQYLDLSAEFMRMKAASGSSLLVGPAMPFWYDGIEDVAWQGRRRSLNEFVQDIYDYVAIMDYRNYAEGSDSIISHAWDELKYGDLIHKKVMIGVETLETTPAKVTFFGKGNKYFEKQLELTESAIRRHLSFGGFVIHHLRPYRILVEDKK